ncbi:MAG: pyridoxal phosphate-dependent aminotransferase [Owenweeksia sp.]
MNLLSDRIQNLSESQTIAMNRKSREMKERGVDVISLSLGEPDFNTPDFIKLAAKQGIDDNYTYYPPIAGYKDVREAISRKFKRDNNLDYSADQIVVSTGAKQSIANVVLCIVNPGDEVLLPAPYWVSYYEIVKLAGGIPVEIPSTIESDFKISGQQLAEAITPKTKMLIFSTPCNPSGSVYSHNELGELAAVLKQHENIVTISDEIYELINFDSKHASLASFSAIYDRVVTVNGVSKGFAMTGWRGGYIGAPLWIAKACDKMQGQFTSAASSITQRALLAAVEAKPDKVEFMRDAFKKRRDQVLEWLNEIPGFKTNLPKGAFYIFPDISALFGKSYQGKTIENSNDLCLYLLEEGRVGLVPGEAFGSPDCLRISYAASEEQLREALHRIKEAVAKLNG